MRFGEYGRIERAISASDNGTIYDRWRYGRRMLCDSEITTPNGNFRHGMIEKLIRASGGKLSERELRYRLQCGRAYPKRSQIGNAVADFGAWRELIQAGFPPYEGEEDELPYNPLKTDELVRQHKTGTERQDEDGQYQGGGFVPREDHEEEMSAPDEEGALIPRDTFPDTTPLRELDRWADEEVELAARHVERARKRRRYVDSLIKAANGNLNATLGEAERSLHHGDN
jgi:hypothetical protein